MSQKDKLHEELREARDKRDKLHEELRERGDKRDKLHEELRERGRDRRRRERDRSDSRDLGGGGWWDGNIYRR